MEAKPTVPHNVDNLISEDAAIKRGVPLKPLEPNVPRETGSENKSEELSHLRQESNSSKPENPGNSESKPDQEISVSETPNNSETKEIKSDQHIDEYGNEIKKTPKELKYSQDDIDEAVNRAVRERLARAKIDQQQSSPRQESKPDQEMDESWETQLESFIDKRLEQRTREQKERDWREKELTKQAEFESKFNKGYDKYHDFETTLRNQKLTDSMMLAIRDFNDPAAFLYSAAKHHADELRQISNIDDPYTQVAKMGALHERMLKGTRRISNAPHVLSTTTSDMPAPPPKKQVSIEERIEEHAKSKRR